MIRGNPEPIYRRYNITHDPDRKGISEALETLGPVERKTEVWCDWVYIFEDEKERIIVKQYNNGTLLIQGRGKTLLQIISQVISGFVKNPDLPPRVNKISEEPRQLSTPHIGTDESGKGDYFGPLVVGGIMIESRSLSKLSSLGIKDSKKLTDTRCRKLALTIRELCVERYCEVIIPPARYNTLYEDFRREGRNLNHMLAWAHARAIESLLDKTPCPLAVADKFGNEYYIRSRLMTKGREIKLIQEHKAERYLAVAAASILARDRFLGVLDKLSVDTGVQLPRGAGPSVIPVARKFLKDNGIEKLGNIAKLHHKTTDRL
tara:strand:+ start:37404 stop:38360 length:957 start_codon:yes stop_codon:yes gene_type:complete